MPSSSDDTECGRRPPTRRAVLAAFATAGCLGFGSGGTDAPGDGSSTPGGTATATPPAGAPSDEVRLGVRNDTDETRELLVRVGEDGRFFDQSVVVDPGVGRSLAAFPAHRDYPVTVEDPTGEVLGRYDWTVEGALRGLQIVLDGDGVRFEQSATCDPTCPPVSEGVESVPLPYRREGAAETFAPGRVEVRSAFDGAVDLDLVVADGETTILEGTYRLERDRSLTLPAVVATEGWYSVEATLDAAGASTTYDWHLAGNRPACFVRVTADGRPRIGCGTEPQPLVLENGRSERVRIDVRLTKRGEEVWQGPIVLSGGSELELRPTAMGDDLTVEATVGEETATGRYVTCYCRGGRTTVGVDAGGVRVDSEILVCD